MEEEYSIIWRRLDVPGHESARLYGDEEGWYLDGAAVFLYQAKPCRLEYLVQCDTDWRTELVTIDGWVGDEPIEYEIEVGEGSREIDGVTGCIDIDLNFSPVTNLLPVRRLDLKIGESKSVRSAWLRFPSFQLEPTDQIYTRIDDSTIRYESGGGSFTADLTVNAGGLVTEYPGFFIAE